MQKEDTIRLWGSMLGKAIATLISAITTRVLGNVYNRVITARGSAETNSIPEEQLEAAVAAVALATWGSDIGAESGAEVSEYLVEKLTDLSYTGVTVSGMAWVTEKVANNFIWAAHNRNNNQNARVAVLAPRLDI